MKSEVGMASTVSVGNGTQNNVVGRLHRHGHKKFIGKGNMSKQVCRQPNCM